LSRGDSSRAIDRLQIAAPFDLALPGTWFGFFGNLYPVYVRGTALLAGGRGAEAVVEFRKILDHPAIVFCDPVSVAARLQLGRSYKLAGDPAKARAAYDDFLKLWENADRDIPMLQQAQAEYAKLPPAAR
jgi:tetratricopeptide (TPR) repeat protein